MPASVVLHRCLEFGDDGCAGEDDDYLDGGVGDDGVDDGVVDENCICIDMYAG